MPPEFPELAGRTFGSWTPVRELGEGGQGVVYLAEKRKSTALFNIIKGIAGSVPDIWEDHLVDAIRELDFEVGALKVIHSLPDDCSLEEIQYRLYFCEKVKRGIQAVDDGKVFPQEEAEARVKEWLR